MDVMIRLCIANPVYQFYKGASAHISERTAESLMVEVLSSYAKTLSKDVRDALEKENKETQFPSW